MAGIAGIVYAFNGAHEVSSICRFPCGDCGEDLGTPQSLTPMTGIGEPEYVERIPIAIPAEATYEDWKRSVLENGGSLGTFASRDPGMHYYFVSMD